MPIRRHQLKLGGNQEILANCQIMMIKPLANQKMNVPAPEGGQKLRAYYTARKPGKKLASVRIKCGCCPQEVVVCFDDQTLEINGVIASIGEWNRVLGPLLNRAETNVPKHTVEETADD